MSANDTQVGGDHYKAAYQHWDFMLDTGAQCPVVYATKYVFRWRKKNGLQDLEKAIHCVKKALDVALPITCFTFAHKHDLDHFLQANDVDIDDGYIIRLIMLGQYEKAISAIKAMLWLEKEKAAEPTSHYVNQGAE